MENKLQIVIFDIKLTLTSFNTDGRTEEGKTLILETQLNKMLRILETTNYKGSIVLFLVSKLYIVSSVKGLGARGKRISTLVPFG